MRRRGGGDGCRCRVWPAVDWWVGWVEWIDCLDVSVLGCFILFCCVLCSFLQYLFSLFAVLLVLFRLLVCRLAGWPVVSLLAGWLGVVLGDWLEPRMQHQTMPHECTNFTQRPRNTVPHPKQERG